MSVADEVRCLRRTVALSDRSDIGLLRVRGAAAWDALDRLLPCELYLRDGEARPTLLLDDAGRVEADVTVLCEDEDLWLLVEGMPSDQVAELVRGSAEAGEEVVVDELDGSHTALGIDGPFAWALLGAWDAPGAMGLPYLSSYRPRPDVLALRSGHTGEYGYLLVAPADRAEVIGGELADAGSALEAGRASAEALSHCAVESWFFDASEPGTRLRTPLELQLQWRVSRRKEFRGSAALRAARATEPPRLTGLRGPTGLDACTPLLLAGARIGTVAVVREALDAPGTLGSAFLERRWAHSGLVLHTAAGTEVRTVSPPFLLNRSLFASPQRHTFADAATLPDPYP